jgi:hypothetical protein
MAKFQGCILNNIRRLTSYHRAHFSSVLVCGEEISETKPPWSKSKAMLQMSVDDVTAIKPPLRPAGSYPLLAGREV